MVHCSEENANQETGSIFFSEGGVGADVFSVQSCSEFNILEGSNNYFKGVYALTKKMVLCTKAKDKINMNMVHSQK